MKRIAALILILSVAFAGCSDNGCKPVKPDAEEAQITAFATANGITATKHSTGMYYQVMNAGSGPTPNINSKVFVTYTGKHLDGSVFEQTSSTVSFYLTGLIEGWQVGLQLIKKGGQIKLLIPSSMAYGCAGSPPKISTNEVVYFDIQLIDVQ